METKKGHTGSYSGNHPRHSMDHAHTRVDASNYKASERDDAAHISYLKKDVEWDAHHGHSDENMTADEKHISKLAGDMKYDKEQHGAAKKKEGASQVGPDGRPIDYNQAPSATYRGYGDIPQHLRFGVHSAAALSNSEAGTNPFAGTGQDPFNQHFTTDNYNPSNEALGIHNTPISNWGNYMPSNNLSNQVISQQNLRNPLTGEVGPNAINVSVGNSRKEHFARHNRLG